MRTILGRDRTGRVVALVVGLAIGFRALNVMRNFNGSGDPLSTGMAQATFIGLVVAVVFVAGLALWLLDHSPRGTGGPRFAALDAGMILGALVGWIVFGWVVLRAV